MNVEDDSLSKKYNAVRKKKIVVNLKSNGNASQLTKWANEIASREDIKDLKGIQKYLAEEKQINNKHDAQIVQTILECKQKDKLFMFKANTFKRYINLYLFSDEVVTKCLTNDYLNLAMIYSNIVEKFKEDIDDYDFSELVKVKIISENFKTTNNTDKGFIQDYDPQFSAICSSVASDETIRDLVENNVNKGEFDYGDDHYIYYGNQDICIIAHDGMNTDEIVNAYHNQEYMRLSNGEFMIGEDTIGPMGGDNAVFINKEITPERFCPCFWIADQRINFSFLFTFQWEYNRLFEAIDQPGKDLNIPRNICYWDSITECFYFLSVVGLTAQNLSNENKRRLTDLASDYFANKQIIGYWKRNQLLFQRICNDFLNCFIYDSDLSRFINLYKKAQHYVDTLNFLTKDNSYNEVLNFFRRVSFAQMIIRQLKDDMYALAKRLVAVLKKYIDATDPRGTVKEIRSVAQEIYNVLPNNNMKDVAFPFICAKGGLLGKLDKYDDEKTDPVLYKAIRNNVRMKKKKEKEEKELNKKSNLLMDASDNKTKFLREYIKLRTKNNKDASYINMNQLINQLSTRIDAMSYAKKAKVMREIAKAFEGKKFNMNPKFKDDELDDSINRHIDFKKNHKKLKKSIEETGKIVRRERRKDNKRIKRGMFKGSIKEDEDAMDIDDDESEEIEDEDDSS